jgi:hypothetical protein
MGFCRRILLNPVALLGFCALPGMAAPSGFVIITRDSGGAFNFIETSTFEVNGKTAVRLLSENSATVDPRQLGRLRLVELSSVACLKVFPDGVMKVKTSADSPWEVVAPDRLAGKSAIPVSEAWSTATLAYRKDRKQKVPEVIHIKLFYALAPASEPAEALAQLYWNERFFLWEGRAPAPAFEERMQLLSAAVHHYASAPATIATGREIATTMQRVLAQWNGGGASYDLLTNGLTWAKISEDAFPAAADHSRFRDELDRANKELLRNKAILESLRDGGACEFFLDRYLGFEPFEQSFRDLQQARRQCYEKTAAEWIAEGRNLMASGEFPLALECLRLAKTRQAAAPNVDQLIEEARVADARRHIAENAKLPRPDPMSTDQTRIRTHLQNAELHLQAGQRAEAEEALKQAQQIDATAPGILLVRSRMSAADGTFTSALHLVDEYESRIARSEDYEAGEKVRTDLNFQLAQAKRKSAPQLEKLFAGNRYQAALAMAQESLRRDPDDLSAMYVAGTSAAVTGQSKLAGELLARFLQSSDSLATPAQQRLTAIRLLRLPKTAAAKMPPSPGESWFSGEPLEANVFYGPMSLAFVPRISNIHVGKHLVTEFSWDQDRPTTVRNRYTDPAAAAGHPTEFFFAYQGPRHRVAQVTSKPVERVPAVQDPWTLTQDGFVVLANAPSLSGQAASIVAGKPLHVGFSGNSFFDPFAWDGFHMFRFGYDDSGRVATAVEIGGDGGLLEFSWDGPRLTGVRKHKAGAETPVIYSRTLSYSNDRLLSEAVSFGGRASKIAYKYDKNGKLIEAEADDDPALGTQQRKVAFE